jgi:tetratricopeptide (TPR) repeat protein
MPGDPGIELTKLEYEFATDPNSEAFIPLAEAYLGMGRFVEAMVVCKKGIKAHPDLPTGRLIMARIYRDQAKHQKAIEEVNKLLKMSPENPDAHRLMGSIHLKLGKTEDGIKSLKKTLDLKPDDQEARESLLKIGIDYIPSAAAPPAPLAQAQSAVPATAVPMDQRPTEQAMPVVEPSRPPGQSGIPTQQAMPVVTPTAQSAIPQSGALSAVSAPPQKKRIADIYQEMEAVQAKPKKSNSFKTFLYMAGALGITLIIYIIYTWQAGLRQKEINGHLEEGRAFFNQDSYVGYQKALEHYRAIHKLDRGQPEALSRSAFIAAVLVGEYGEQQTVNSKGKPIKLIDFANQYIGLAMSRKQETSMLLAAQGMMALYGGGSMNDTVDLLENGLKSHPDSAVIHTALGQVMLKKGELGEAKDHLLKGAGQSEMRAFISLGQYAMRRSMYREANQAFNKALGTNRNHIKAVLNKGMLTLLWGGTARYTLEAKRIHDRFKADLEKNASEKDKVFAEFIAAVVNSRSVNRREAKAGWDKIRKLLKQDSSNSLFQFAAAREMRRTGKLKEAKETIKMALRLDSTRPDFVLEEASVFLTMRDYESARARALRVQEMDTESGQSLLIAGDAYLGEKNYAKAKKYFKDATKFDDVVGMAHMKLGGVYMMQPNPDIDRAQAQYELAVQPLSVSGQVRTAAEVCFKLAKAYAKKNRVREFNAILMRAIKIDPTYGPPYCFLATNLSMENKESRDQAVEMCKNCIKLASGEQTGGCRKILK